MIALLMIFIDCSTVLCYTVVGTFVTERLDQIIF